MDDHGLRIGPSVGGVAWCIQYNAEDFPGMRDQMHEEQDNKAADVDAGKDQNRHYCKATCETLSKCFQINGYDVVDYQA